MKRDGHTHTHYCLHGSGEETEEFIIQAIREGFQMYSLTEHMPLPEKFLAGIRYTQEFKDSIEILGGDFDSYIRDMQKLKKKYRDKIQILIGAEVDFLSEEQEYIRMFLNEYGPYLEDSILSVHMIRGREGWRCVDYNPQDYQEGLVDYYSSYEQVHREYYRTVQEALQADLGRYKPKRIGHLTICSKFRLHFDPRGENKHIAQDQVLDLLDYMKEHGYSLDMNVAGLFKKHCRETYVPQWVVRPALRLGIPLVYGSDAHAVKDVGRAYDVYEKMVSL